MEERGHPCYVLECPGLSGAQALWAEMGGIQIQTAAGLSLGWTLNTSHARVSPPRAEYRPEVGPLGDIEEAISDTESTRLTF